jgi:FHA domain/Double zinc ribbon
LATLTCPGCAAVVQQDDLICFTCGTNLPRTEQPDEPTTPPTVMQESLRRDGATASSLAPAECPRCGAAIPDRSMLACPACDRPLPRSSGPISPVVLRLSFPTGNVDVPAGTSLVLGRDPEESLVAAAFFKYENVSRRHATVAVTDAGEATIRDERSTNGTFINGDATATGSGWPPTSRPRSHFPTRGWTRPRSARMVTGIATRPQLRPGWP